MCPLPISPKSGYLELGTWMPVSTKFQEHKCQIKMWLSPLRTLNIKIALLKPRINIQLQMICMLGKWCRDMNEIYTYSGSGYSIDMGAMYSVSDLTLSLFARNLILKLSIPIPMTLIIWAKRNHCKLLWCKIPIW